MVTKSVLNIFKGLAEVRPKDYEIARRISKILKLGIKEEDFIDMHILDRKTPYSDDVISSIIINLKNQEIEVTILDSCYFVTNSFDKYGYQFIKEYIYEVKEPISESFSINNGKCALNIKEEYPSSSISVENKDMSLTRIHIDNFYTDESGNNYVNITTSIDEMENNEFNQHNEVFYFPKKEDMYHISIFNKEDEYSLMAGATLNSPRYKLYPGELTPDEEVLYGNVGLLQEPKSTLPKIYLKAQYIENGEVNTINNFELSIVKYKTILGFHLNENGEEKTDKMVGTPTNNITVNDLVAIKERIIATLGDKSYLDLIINYIDELIFRLSYRQKYEFKNIVSYNGDIFDYYIVLGKDMYGTPGRDIEHRAFDIYERKDNLEVLLDNVKIPDVRIKAKENTLTKTSE